jgi:hypothetical protein
MPKFRKKPIVIEAIQITRDNIVECLQFTNNKLLFHPFLGALIDTLGGKIEVEENDWLIKGVNGEFYPCKPDIFEKTYEKA